MTEILPQPSALTGEGASKGCLDLLDIGSLGFVWDLGFEDWYFN